MTFSCRLNQQKTGRYKLRNWPQGFAVAEAFDGIATSCSAMTTSPQTARNLEGTHQSVQGKGVVSRMDEGLPRAEHGWKQVKLWNRW